MLDFYSWISQDGSIIDPFNSYNEFAHALDEDIHYREFTLVNDDNTTGIIDYLKRGEVPIKRFNDVVLMCLPQADKYLMAKYKFFIADTEIDDRILKVLSSYGIIV